MTTIITPAEIEKLLNKTKFFQGANHDALLNLIEKSEIIEVKKEEVIIHEGEYETVCYIPLSGRFRIMVTDKKLEVKREMATLGVGEILGEMSALTGKPRFAEVACIEDAVTLKIERDELLLFLDNSPVIKNRVDADYKERSLISTLRKLEIFSLVDDLSLKDLAENIEFITFQKNESIFLPGDVADGFFVIKDGFVKLSRELENSDSAFFDSRFDKQIKRPTKHDTKKDFIMAYLGSDSYFGERALFRHRRRKSGALAVTRVELLRIGLNDFMKLMKRHPQVEMKMKEYAETRYEDTIGITNFADQEMLSWVEDSDILSGGNILILDLDRCVRCLNCIDACAMLHHGVTRITHNGIRFKNILIPTSCRHCREPTCMIGCPTGAIQRDIHGEVFHTEACIGCGNCARRCPFGNISMVELGKIKGKQMIEERMANWVGSFFKSDVDDSEKTHVKRKAVKCDMCKGYDHRGCEHNCPTAAILTVEPSKYFHMTKR